jgi:ligand-binding sensor domain-containing protein
VTNNAIKVLLVPVAVLAMMAAWFFLSSKPPVQPVEPPPVADAPPVSPPSLVPPVVLQPETIQPPPPKQAVEAEPVAPPVVEQPPAASPEKKVDTHFWKEITGLSNEGMMLQEDAKGNVWLTTKYDITMYRNGDAGSAVNMTRTVGPKNEATSATYALDENECWAGTWNGRVFHKKDGEWELFSQDALRGKVVGLTVADKNLFAAATTGLFLWREEGRRWQPVSGFQTRTIKALYSSRAGKLYVAGEDTIWQKSQESWPKIATVPGDILSLCEDANGKLIVGTRDGVKLLDASGQVVSHELPTLEVTGVGVRSNGVIWVGTRTRGLYFKDAGGWHKFGYSEGLPVDYVNGVLVDRHDRLWWVTYGATHGTAPAEGAETAIKLLAKAPVAGQVFALASRAVEILLEGKTESGQVACLKDRSMVFFNGRQVFPVARYTSETLSYRRKDGAISEINSKWSTTLTRRVQDRPEPVSETLTPPDPIPPVPPLVNFLDSSDRLWVAAYESGGVFLNQHAGWSHIGGDTLAKVAVAAIAEDADKSIWIAARSQGQLFQYTGTDLSLHESPVVKGSMTNDLLALKNGEIALGTNSGIYIYNLKANAFRRINCGVAFNVSQDATGRLWASHYMFGLGITCVDGAAFQRYDSRNGLYADHIRASAHDANGNVWLIAEDGQVGVYPAAFFVMKQPDNAASK